jgi:hypothetical protein
VHSRLRSQTHVSQTRPATEKSLFREFFHTRWRPLARLAAAGKIATRSSNFAMPGVVYKKMRSRHWTSIDMGLKPNRDNRAVEALLLIVPRQFSKKEAWPPVGPGS